MLILLDEIFGKENRKNIITVKRGSVTGAKVINPGVVNIVEYIVIYSKDTAQWKPNRVYSAKGYDDRYNTYITNIEKPYTEWIFSTVLEAIALETGINKSKLKKHFGDSYEQVIEDFVINHADSVCRWAALDENSVSADAVTLKNESRENPDKIFYFPRADANDYYIRNGNIILFAKDRMIESDGRKSFSTPISDIWDDVLPNDLHNEGGVEFKKGKKPEKLLQRLFELCTAEGDIILDFFAGSGTAGAVAQKMKRQYILCEQMDYIKTTTRQRLCNVIAGESRGISQSVHWQGGGSFVYCELKELNAQYIDAAQSATNEEELLSLFGDITKTGFISQKIKPSDIDTAAKEFQDLSFKDKRRLFIELINKNMLYVNLCDMDDTEFAVTVEEKAFTNSFYGRD